MQQRESCIMPTMMLAFQWIFLHHMLYHQRITEMISPCPRPHSTIRLSMRGGGTKSVNGPMRLQTTLVS